MAKLRTHWGLATAIAVSAAAYIALVVIDQMHGTLRDEYVPTSIGWYLVAFFGFAVAVWWNEHSPIDRRWLWTIPIVFRLLLLFTEPTLSDDVYRYLWDGHLVAEGVNPYANVINAAELDPFEIPARRLANNPSLSSPYLPAAHAVFGGAAAVLPSEPLTMQVIMSFFDIGAALLITKLLTYAGLPAGRVILYLWNPLVIIETAHAAHLDALMIFLTLAALVLTLRPSADDAADGPERTHRWRSVAAPIVFALAVLTRPIPILLAPVLFWRWTWPQRFLAGGTAVALILPFGFGAAGFGLGDDASGRGVFGSARVYSSDFRFNAGIAHWLETTFGQAAASAVVALAMAVIGGTTWLLARRATSALSVLRLATLPLMGYVALTPVLHPWYLTILLTLLVFVTPTEREGSDRWLLLLPWSYLTVASPLSYITYRNPQAFAELSWVRWVEWYPTLALLVFTSFWVFFAIHAEDPIQPDTPASSGNS